MAALMLLRMTLQLLVVSLALMVLVATSSSYLSYSIWKHHKIGTSFIVKTTFSTISPAKSLPCFIRHCAYYFRY